MQRQYVGADRSLPLICGSQFVEEYSEQWKKEEWKMADYC